MNEYYEPDFHLDSLAGALSKIVWAYALIHLHLPLNNLDLLPDWLGYILIVTALPVLNQYVPSAKLLKPFGVVLVVWNLFQWGVNFAGDGSLPPVINVIFGIISVYFTFQLLSNIAETAEQTGCGNPEGICRLRNADAVLTTILFLPLSWENTEGYRILAFILLVTGLGIVIAIFLLLNGLKNELQEKAAQPEEE